MRSRRRKPLQTSKPETLIQALPGFVHSFFLILLMWLFAELIFLPLSAESFTKDLAGRVTSIVAAAFIIAIGSMLPQAARDGDLAVTLLSTLLVKGRYAKTRRPKMQRLFESLGRALLLGVLGIIVGSLFYWVHPLFGGMALLATIILVFIFVFKGATQASEEIVQRLVHRKARR